MSGRNQFVAKSVILLLLILLWVASGCFIFVGAYALHAGGDISHVAQSTYVFVPAILCLSVGAVLFVLGLLGCFACTMDNRPMLIVFFVLILVVFLGQIAAAVCGLAFRDKLAANVERALDKELETYAEDKSLGLEIDFIQSTYQCCGVRNYTDWYESSWYQKHNSTLPGSCCQGGNCSEPRRKDSHAATPMELQTALNNVLSDLEMTFVRSVKKVENWVRDVKGESVFTTMVPATTHTSFYTSVGPTPLPKGAVFPDPCLTKLEKVLKRNFGWITALAVFFAVLEIMGLIATFVVMQRSNDIQYEQFGIVTEGLNV